MKKATSILFLLVIVFSLSSPSNDGFPSDYQSWSAQEKIEFLWNKKMAPTAYRKLPEPKDPSYLALLDLGNPVFLWQTLVHVSDEIPAGRTKLIHTYGSVGLIEYVPESNSPYTGILETGALGIARLSVATDPRIDFTPGMALKFLIDGKPSVNIMVMERVEGQGTNQNFFARSLTNNLPKATTPKSILIETAFGMVKDSPGHLSVRHLSKTDTRGNNISKAKWPWLVVFKPTAQVQMDPRSRNDFRTNLSKIPADTILYEVWSRETRSSKPVLIGKLVSRSPFQASDYGDRNLFFQHDDFEED